MRLRPFVRFAVDCPYSATEAYYRILPVVEQPQPLLTRYFDSFKHNDGGVRRYLGYVNRAEFVLRYNRLSTENVWQGRLPIITGKIHGSGSSCMVDIVIRPRWLLLIGFVVTWLLYILYVGFIRANYYHMDLIYSTAFLGFVTALGVKHCFDVDREKAFLLDLFETDNRRKSGALVRGFEPSAK